MFVKPSTSSSGSSSFFHGTVCGIVTSVFCTNVVGFCEAGIVREGSSSPCLDGAVFNNVMMLCGAGTRMTAVAT